MHFDKETVYPHRHRGTRERLRKFPLPARALPRAARELETMSDIKNNRMTERPYDRNSAKIDHKIIVTERGAPFRYENIPISRRDEFLDDILDIPWGEKLTLFYVDGLAGLRGGKDQVRLTAKECGYLQGVQHLGRGFHVIHRVDVGDYRNMETAPGPALYKKKGMSCLPCRTSS